MHAALENYGSNHSALVGPKKPTGGRSDEESEFSEVGSIEVVKFVRKSRDTKQVGAHVQHSVF